MSSVLSETSALERLANGDHWQRVAALEEIGQGAAPASAEVAAALCGVLEDEAECRHIKEAAVAAAGALELKAARAHLERLLRDEDLEVRVRAARALGRLALPESIRALKQATARANPDELREAARAAVAAITRSSD